MNVVKVEYTVRPDFVEANKKNIERVMSELRALGDVGVKYFTYIKEDGISFIHIAIRRDGEAAKIVPNLESFREFRAQLKSGVQIPPVSEEYDLVGKSFEL